MKAGILGVAGWGFAAWLGSNVPSVAQVAPADAAALRSAVVEVLSLTMFGMFQVQDQAAQVTRDGSAFHVSLPLAGLESPPNAAAKATAHPLGDGVWEISGLTLPSAWTAVQTEPDSGTRRIAGTIAEQAIHARVDPGFVRPSSFVSRLSGVATRLDQGQFHIEQTLGQADVEGAVSGETAGRLTFALVSKAGNWQMMLHGSDGADGHVAADALTNHLTLEDLDRAQGSRLIEAGRALIATVRQTAQGLPMGEATQRRLAVRAMVDAFAGLLSRLEADQTLEGVSFATGPATSGTIHGVHVNLAGGAADQRLNGHMALAVDGLAMGSGMPAQASAYVPRHVDMASSLAGLRIDKLMALLRAAAEQEFDPVRLQDEFVRMLNEPGTRIGIDQMSFDSGPVRVTGSARVVPHADRPPGAAIHLSATGMDALLAQAQSLPVLQGALPVLFMAKGMGRVEGDAVVWDVALGEGPVTINGVPFGNPMP